MQDDGQDKLSVQSSGTTYKVGYTSKSVGSSQGCQPTDARTILWASMSLITPAKEFGAQEPLKQLVNSLGENCQDCEALACLTLKTCGNFMNHGTLL